MLRSIMNIIPSDGSDDFGDAHIKKQRTSAFGWFPVSW